MNILYHIRIISIISV